MFCVEQINKDSLNNQMIDYYITSEINNFVIDFLEAVLLAEQEEYTIGVNEVIDINYSYLPENATNIDFSWTASDTSVLNVYWNKVRGLQEGKAYIIIKTPDGSLEKRIKIIVEEQ